ncbi:pentapeptide repeat-containing protein [Halosquirtibacter xylanolyticus]|uniref:pentapeptide repeat-containing protein n=1 Tax=Halosquirtibacter xylanolyticus TaxID=3374599 RepID=UPI003749C75D|nr:pentapeptide repeat-containing protein [Prolixibacteraceae bacterium]
MDIVEEKECREIATSKTHYIDCVFKQVDIKASDIKGYEFEDCEFIGCDFSMVDLTGVAFRTVTFKECLMQGVAFNAANPFLLSMTFDHCRLDQSVFLDMDLRSCHFKYSQFKHGILESCKLQKVAFDETELEQTLFYRCDLSQADFRTAINLSFDPDNNKMKGAKFSIQTALGLLAKYQIKITP